MRLRTIVLAMITAVGLLAGIPTAAAEPAVIDWEPCYPQVGPSYECAVVHVPLDHGEPDGQLIPIAVAKLPATDQANKIGSLFLNPGGPGGSGVDFLLGAGPILFNDEVRASFDLIGFDPRGVRRSGPLKCFRGWGDLFSALPPGPFPLTEDELAIYESQNEILVGFCDANAKSIIDHMSTADVARDMDVLREMLGDEGLTYYGVSYGSMLGNTYANLFPDNVRSVVIDAVLDPVAWTTGAPGEEHYPFSYRLRSDQGAQDTLDEFFRLCDESGAACAFGPDSEARFAALADRLLAEGPIDIVDPVSGQTFPFSYQDLIGSSLGPLYNSASWPAHAEFLAFIEAGASAAVLGEALATVRELAGFDFPNGPYPGFEQFLGVSCSDSDNPDTHQAWFDAGQKADANYGYFGSLWTWASGPCAIWNGVAEDRYAGPFTADTVNPVLVVGTRYDPATRYEGAVIADDLLANSALLTVEGWGHSSLFLSQCADDAIADYLLNETVPAQGATCFQDWSPFGGAADADVLERQQMRRDIMQYLGLGPNR